MNNEEEKYKPMGSPHKDRLGDEAPGWKHMLFALLAVGVIMLLSWIAWFKWGWFH